MTSGRNPMKDRVAIAGAATTGFQPRNTGRSQASYVAEACKAVLEPVRPDAAGRRRPVRVAARAPAVQSMLGIPEVTWFANPMIPFGNHLAAAASAVHSGLCDVVLAYHGAYRMAWNTGSALKDPFRRGAAFGSGRDPPAGIGRRIGRLHRLGLALHPRIRCAEEEPGLRGGQRPDQCHGQPRRGHARPADDGRLPLGPDDQISAVPVRHGHRGRRGRRVHHHDRRAGADLRLPPVLVNAVVLGMTDKNEEDQTPSLRRHGQQVTVQSPPAKSDFWIDDIDVFFPYDGFSIIALNWLENVGYCDRAKPGRSSRTTGSPTTTEPAGS